jgi:hypothetical protein
MSCDRMQRTDGLLNMQGWCYFPSHSLACKGLSAAHAIVEIKLGLSRERFGVRAVSRK